MPSKAKPLNKAERAAHPLKAAVGDRLVWNPLGKKYVLLPLTLNKRACQQIAKSDESILITGETGTGKEELADLLVAHSKRKQKPFTAINCAALGDEMVTSEFFGHVQGAFTGAHRDRPGRLAELDGGTVLLDEIGDVPINHQAKILRFMQTGEIQPLGSDSAKLRMVDVRVLAATNIDKTNTKFFREDLRQRFVHEIELPALRDRSVDIIYFLVLFLSPFDVFTGITLQCLLALHSYAWPGNIREMNQMCDRAKMLAASPDATDKSPKEYVLKTLAGAETPAFNKQVYDLMDCLLAYYDWKRRGAAKDDKKLYTAPLTMNSLQLIADLRRLASVYREENPEFPREIMAYGYEQALPLATLADPRRLPYCYDFTVFQELIPRYRRFTLFDLRHALNALGELLRERHRTATDAIARVKTQMQSTEYKLRSTRELPIVELLATHRVDAIDYGKVDRPQELLLAKIKKGLSDRERQIMQMHLAKFSVRKIANELNCAKTLVQDTINRIRLDNPKLFHS